MTTGTDLHKTLRIAVGRVSQSGLPIDFDAGPADLQRIASDLGLTAMAQFKGSLVAMPWQKAGVQVTGILKVAAVQESVVTLEPIETDYVIDFDMIFVPEHSRLAPRKADFEDEIFVDPEGEEPPEPFSGDHIDLAPYVEEHLVLAIDPYPRRPNETFETIDTDPEPEAGKVSPFADLAALRKQQGDKN
ncbi:DUF177 domain-containing protein [Fulvimarina sp. MAC3]|uniref:YceD family protein n=1 Tax=Fulvimarina sp. MAC3 TaxID=3148887 RepID=UPI0031FD9EC3